MPLTIQHYQVYKMSVKQEFKFIVPEGQEFLDINIWANSLSAEDRAEWDSAVVRQLAIREQVVGETLQVDTAEDEEHRREWQKIASTYPLGECPPYIPRVNNYVWKEDAVKDKPPLEYKPYDEVWLKYWNRYLAETGIKFESVETKI
jgi:hypothetical protein